MRNTSAHVCRGRPGLLLWGPGGLPAALEGKRHDGGRVVSSRGAVFLGFALKKKKKILGGERPGGEGMGKVTRSWWQGGQSEV